MPSLQNLTHIFDKNVPLHPVGPEGIDMEVIVYRGSYNQIETTLRFGPPIPKHEFDKSGELIATAVKLPSLLRTTKTCSWCQQPFTPAQWVYIRRALHRELQIIFIDIGDQVYVQYLGPLYEKSGGSYVSSEKLKVEDLVHVDCIKKSPELKEVYELETQIENLEKKVSTLSHKLWRVA